MCLRPRVAFRRPRTAFHRLPIGRRRTGVGHIAFALSLLAALSACATDGAERNAIVLHGSFGDAGAQVRVKGRVGESGEIVEIDAADAPRLNFRRSSALFLAEECEECPVELMLGDAPPLDTEYRRGRFLQRRDSPRGRTGRLVAARRDERGGGASRRGAGRAVRQRHRHRLRHRQTDIAKVLAKLPTGVSP